MFFLTTPVHMKTESAKISQFERKWYVADANGKVLGRFASGVAKILRGKHKPIFTPHIDTGDHVVIINADKIRVTGKKLDDKTYDNYSGYPSGRKVRPLKRMLDSKPEFVLTQAIKGMLPHNKLGRKMMKKVRIYAGSEHPHQSQFPEVLDAI